MFAEWREEELNVHTRGDSLVCDLWMAVPAGVWVPVAGDLRFVEQRGYFQWHSGAHTGVER